MIGHSMCRHRSGALTVIKSPHYLTYIVDGKEIEDTIMFNNKVKLEFLCMGCDKVYRYLYEDAPKWLKKYYHKYHVHEEVKDV